MNCCRASEGRRQRLAWRLALAALLGLLGLAFPALAFDVTGTVCGPDGTPLDGAQVWAWQAGAVRRATTGPDGRFRVEGLAVGPMDVFASGKGCAVNGFSGVLAGELDMPLRLGANPVALEVRVLGSDYEPAAGARAVELWVNGQFRMPLAELAGHGFEPVRSDEEGLLTIAGLPAGGHVQLLLSHRRHADTFVEYLPLREEMQTVALTPGERLAGRIVTPDGAPAQGAVAAAVREGVHRQRVLARDTADPEGFYALRVPAGPCWVGAAHPEYASPPPHAVAIRAGQDEHVVDLRLLEAHRVRGRVLGPDGAPVPAVSVHFDVDVRPYTETLTGADGRFEIVAPEHGGLLRIVPPDGYMTEHVAVVPVDFGGRREAVLSPTRLEPLPRIKGVVRGEDGAPAPGCLVRSLNLTPPVWLITDDEGAFETVLLRMPEGGRASFRAEHAARFLRADFEAALRNPKLAKPKLKPFEPELGRPEPVAGRNDLSPLVNQPAPAWDCKTWFQGSAAALESLHGRVVVALFWAGFDTRPENVACIEELRAHHDLLEDFDDVAFVAIHDSTSTADEVRHWLDAFKIPFAAGQDAEPFKTFERYRIVYIPQVVVIDKDGVLRYWQTEGRLLELIKALRRK